jgi:hypothetical protein
MGYDRAVPGLTPDWVIDAGRSFLSTGEAKNVRCVRQSTGLAPPDISRGCPRRGAKPIARWAPRQRLEPSSYLTLPIFRK